MPHSGTLGYDFLRLTDRPAEDLAHGRLQEGPLSTLEKPSYGVDVDLRTEGDIRIGSVLGPVV